MRSNGCNRLLDNLYPLLAVTLLVLVVVHWNNLILKQRVDGSSIELVLITLVLVCTLLCKSPSSTLAVALKPPSIEYREIYYTVHLGLLA